MSEKDAVIGLGEVGQALYEILSEKYDVVGMDFDKPLYEGKLRYMHICIPWGDKFLEIVEAYQVLHHPELTIIHSTVPIGTTVKLENSVHSPVRGRHDNMKESLRKFPKWVGANPKIINKYVEDFALYLNDVGIDVTCVASPDKTEALKLISLAKYGANLAFAGYQQEICDSMHLNYNQILKWDKQYNEGVNSELQRPILTPPKGKIGGHCVIQNTKLLNEQFPNQILDEILKYSGEEKDYKAYEPSNIYPTAKIGKNVQIGAFSEIGNNVVIEDDVRIGAFAFIPEGVTIKKGAWIGPRVTFTNDKYPPSGKDSWQDTVVEEGARIGAGVTVLCGVIIGQIALVGAGSVVTKNIPTGETWAGVPAKNILFTKLDVVSYTPTYMEGL